MYTVFDKFYARNKIVCCRIREKLDGVFSTRLKMCQEHLDIEMKSRDMQWKIYRKEKCLAWVNLVTDMHQNGVSYNYLHTVGSVDKVVLGINKSPLVMSLDFE